MKKLAILLLLLIVTAAAGCSTSKEQPDNTAQTNFKQLMTGTVNPRELIDFADHNISTLTKKDATSLVLRLESVQQKQLDSRTDAWLNADKQASLQQFPFNITLDDMIKTAKDQELKDMLIETRAGGFKLIPLEGAYYPIIDYEKFRIYQPYVSDDIKSYIDIAAAESEQICLSDAALVITWPELTRRTLRAEAFVKDYPTSPKIEDVRQQYDIYVSSCLYGANNTPAFDYETKTLVEEAKKSYYEIAKNPEGSSLAEVIEQYLPILEKNQFKRTAEVDQFLQNAEKSLKSAK